MSNSSNQQNDENQRVPDLVHDSRLTTCFLPNGATQHTVYHQSRNRRPARVNETWYRQRELGNGSFGCVWLERCASGPAEGKLRAVKDIRKDPSLPVSYSRELEAMAKFSHERYVHCFVECYGWYESETMVFIAMEYIKHGDLQNYLNQPFSEAHARAIGSQLVEGLGYMHENGFAHRDLKPKNILVYEPGPDWWVKIADLGISKRAEGTALRTAIGTEGYVAPEVIGFVPDQSSSSSDAFSYTFAVDMWGLGELLFRMMTQRPAFPNRHSLFNHVINEHPFPVLTLRATGASQDCCNFVTKCMTVDPERRLKASEAAVHPWVQTSQPVSRPSGRSSPISRCEEPLPISANAPIWPATPNLQPAVYFEDTAQWSTASQETQKAQDRWLTSIPIGATHKKVQQPQVTGPGFAVDTAHAQHSSTAPWYGLSRQGIPKEVVSTGPTSTYPGSPVSAVGFSISGDWEVELIISPDLHSFSNTAQDLCDSRGLRLLCATTFMENGQRRWAGVARAGDWANRWWISPDLPSFKKQAQDHFDSEALRLIYAHTYVEKGNRFWIGISRGGNWASRLFIHSDLAEFSSESQKLFDDQGLRMIHVTTWLEGGKRWWLGISRSGDWANWWWISPNLGHFSTKVQQLFDDEGKRLVYVSTYKEGDQRKWIGIARSAAWAHKWYVRSDLDSLRLEAQQLLDHMQLRIEQVEFLE